MGQFPGPTYPPTANCMSRGSQKSIWIWSWKSTNFMNIRDIVWVCIILTFYPISTSVDQILAPLAFLVRRKFIRDLIFINSQMRRCWNFKLSQWTPQAWIHWIYWETWDNAWIKLGGLKGSLLLRTFEETFHQSLQAITTLVWFLLIVSRQVVMASS